MGLLEGEVEERNEKVLEINHEHNQESDALAEAEGHLDMYTKRCEELRRTTEDQQAELTRLEAELRDARAEHSRRVNEQTSLAADIQQEREQYEQLLALRIERVERDIVKVIYWRIDPRNASREFSYTLDVSSLQIRVTDCSPPLMQTTIDHAILEFAASNSIGRLFKEMRMAFASLL